jgi:capsular exopolysaccharide synthesis family protein
VVIHETPTEAALWANTIADEYIAVTLANRVDAAKRAYTWLQERLAATQREMRDAQDKLFRSYQSQDLFVPEGSVSAVSRSITKLNEDYVAATSRRIEIEAALKQAITMREQGLGLDQIPQIAHDAQVAGFNGQLVSQSLELARLKEKFKEGHPEVQKLLGQIEHVRKAKDARALEIIEGLRAEYAQLQKRETELRAATDKQKATAASQSRRVTELETLKKEAESAKSLYDVLLQKLNESDIAASIRSNNVTIVERASPPRTPVKPDKRRMAAVALVMGLALGVGLVLGRDYLDNTIKDPEEVERYLHLDLLASVPRYEDGSAHLVTEAYQNLRTALIFARRSEGGQVVLVTGSVPQEGKTTTLVNIGKLLAASGERTIVLDFDLRRATLHTQLGLLREPGLTNYFVSHDDLNVLIRPTRVANLYALTAGPIPPNPPALLARRELTALIAELRQHFDWILLDSPPLASVTDALLLARHADLAVMVVRHNKVDKKLVKRSVVALRRVTPNLLGAVLNAVDAKGKGYHYYYHYRAQDTPVSKQAAG